MYMEEGRTRCWYCGHNFGRRRVEQTCPECGTWQMAAALLGREMCELDREKEKRRRWEASAMFIPTDDDDDDDDDEFPIEDIRHT